jgi:hypothetical protein
VPSFALLLFDNKTSSSAAASTNPNNATAIVAAGTVDRWTLTGAKGDRSPPTIVANLTISAVAQLATGLRVKNVTLNGDVVLQHTYPHYGDSWHVVTVAPPAPFGWVSAPLMQTTAVILDVHMTCGGLDAFMVRIAVPAPGVVQLLAAEVKAAASSSQLIALAAGGASSGAALGRVMATRSMVMCDADAAIGGGVLDLGLVPCAAEDNSNNTARSAVVSNVVLVCAVGLVILAFGLVLAARDRGRPFLPALRVSTAVVLLPSSLLPVLVAVVPSTASSAALLAARLESSTCHGVDAVLVGVAVAVVVAPVVGGALVLRVTARCGWECVRLEAAVPPSDAFALTRALRYATRRRYKWQPSKCRAITEGVTTTASAPMQRMWVVLLEYRELWYAALDCCGLVAVGALAVVGGLAPASCRLFTGVVIALQCVQLLVLVVVQPYTTLFEWIYSVVTLSLTILSVV